MENCLVTKLKGSIDNANVPELNTIYLDLLAPDKRNAMGRLTSRKPGLVVYLNGGSVHIESQIDMYTTSSSTTGVRSIDIADTSVHYYYFDTIANLPDVAIEKCIKITGDIYQIRNLYQRTVGRIFGFRESTKNGLKSMSFASNLVAYGGAVDNLDDITINPTTAILVLNMPQKNINIDKLSQTNVAYIGSTDINGSTTQSVVVKAAVVLNEATAANTTLVGIGFRCYGDVVNLPVNTIAITETGSGFYGHFDDYYQRIREIRPEGKMAIACTGSTTINAVTVNDHMLGYYYSQGNYIAYKGSNYAVIAWDENGVIVDKTAWDSTLVSAINNTVIMTEG